MQKKTKKNLQENERELGAVDMSQDPTVLRSEPVASKKRGEALINPQHPAASNLKKKSSKKKINLGKIGKTIKRVVTWPGRQIEKELRGQEAMDKQYEREGKANNARQSGMSYKKKAKKKKK